MCLDNLASSQCTMRWERLNWRDSVGQEKLDVLPRASRRTGRMETYQIMGKQIALCQGVLHALCFLNCKGWSFTFNSNGTPGRAGDINEAGSRNLSIMTCSPYHCFSQCPRIVLTVVALLPLSVQFHSALLHSEKVLPLKGRRGGQPSRSALNGCAPTAGKKVLVRSSAHLP